MKKALKLVIFLLIIFGGFYLYLFNFEKSNELISKAGSLILSVTNSNESEEFETPEPEDDLPQTEITVSAWIPYWDETRGFQIFSDNFKKIESVSPVWFYVNSDGTITQRKKDADISRYVNQVHEKGKLIIPTITNSSEKEFSEILNNENLLKTHIANIYQLTAKYDFDGIDIDYENLKGTDKEAFSNFVKLLSEDLHASKKILTIAVLPKTDNIIYQFSSARQAQDWSEIGKYVDEFRIMGYDWSHNSTTSAGPISPTYWLEEILDYAVANISKEKIVLALPLYGYKWGTSITALTWEDVQKIKNSGNAKDTFDESSEENQIIADNFEAWYHDARTINARKEIAKSYEIKGVIFWRLGGEDPDIWK